MEDRLVCRVGFFLLLVCATFLTVARHTTAAEAKDADVTPVVDDSAYDLQYKLLTGMVLRYNVEHKAAVRSTIDDTTQEALTKTDSVKVWKVTDVLPGGNIELMNVVEQVHMVNQLPDRAKTEYNSEKDKTPPPGYEDAARSVGVPLSVVRMTPRGEVVSHKRKFQQGPAEQDAQVIVRLPDDPVKVGATWDEPFDVTVQIDDGATKSIQTRRHYKLTNVATGIATIEVTYQVLSPIDAKIESQLVQRLMKGKVRFDIEHGRVDSQNYEVDKRILGFAGPTSSMHYVMSMEERLDDSPSKTATRPTNRRKVSQKPTRSAGRTSPKSSFRR